jgi:hypothetical protein
MADGNPCLGCQKSFNTTKKLHAHQARCEANKRLKASLVEAQKRLHQIKSKAVHPAAQVHHPEQPHGHSIHPDPFDATSVDSRSEFDENQVHSHIFACSFD